MDPASKNGIKNTKNINNNIQNLLEFNANNNNSNNSCNCNCNSNNNSNNNSNSNTNENINNPIYVYGVGSSATENDLYAIFAHIGQNSMKIKRVNVIKNSKTGECKGYGFVEFESQYEAQFAVNSMNGFNYHNRQLQVSFKKEQQKTMLNDFSEMKLADTALAPVTVNETS